MFHGDTCKSRPVWGNLCPWYIIGLHDLDKTIYLDYNLDRKVVEDL